MNLERTYLGTPEERRQARAALSSGRELRTAWIRAVIFTAVLIVLLARQFRTTGRLDLFGTFWPVLLIGVFLVGFAILRRGRLRTSGGPTSEITIAITDAALEAKSGFGIRREWQKVHSVIETETLFVFAMQPGVGHFLPKRVVSDAEIAMLRRFLHEKLGSRARLQKPASL